MHKIIRYVLTLGLTLALQSALAETYYQVEMVVFSQNSPTTEVFDQIESKIRWPNAMTELSAYQPTDLSLLKDGSQQLLRDPAYQAMGQFSWIQPANSSGALLPVHVQSLDGRLEGLVQLRDTPPFEVQLDFEQKSDRVSPAGRFYLYRLTEKRLIKPNEVNYFDHPKMGILLAVRPL